MGGLSSKWTLLGQDWDAESMPRLCERERETERERKRQRGRGRKREKRETS